jgi:hypothetical protein
MSRACRLGLNRFINRIAGPMWGNRRGCPILMNLNVFSIKINFQGEEQREDALIAGPSGN